MVTCQTSDPPLARCDRYYLKHTYILLPDIINEVYIKQSQCTKNHSLSLFSCYVEPYNHSSDSFLSAMISLALERDDPQMQMFLEAKF